MGIVRSRAAAPAGVRVALVFPALNSALQEMLEHSHRSDLPSASRYLSAMRAGTLAAVGRYEEAERTWRLSGLPDNDADCLDLEGQTWREMEAIAEARLRILRARKEFDAARAFSSALVQTVEQRGLRRTRMRCLQHLRRGSDLQGQHGVPPAGGAGAARVVLDRLPRAGDWGTVRRCGARGLHVRGSGAYEAPVRSIGSLGATLRATFLRDYVERTVNVDGSQDRRRPGRDAHGRDACVSGSALDTDGRLAQGALGRQAEPAVDGRDDACRRRHGWDGTLHRRSAELRTAGAARLDPLVGLNNLFDEDAPVCFPCGVIGMSQVVHDLPGRIGYARATYRR